MPAVPADKPVALKVRHDSRRLCICMLEFRGARLHESARLWPGLIPFVLSASCDAPPPMALMRVRACFHSVVTAHSQHVHIVPTACSQLVHIAACSLHACGSRCSPQLLFPHQSCGVVMGKGGAFIKELSQTTGATIKVSQASSRECSAAARCGVVVVAATATAAVE